MRRIRRSRTCLRASVSIGPGNSAFTRTRGPRSAAIRRLMWARAGYSDVMGKVSSRSLSGRPSSSC